MSKQYVIYNFLNFFYEGDYDNGMPSLTPLHEYVEQDGESEEDEHGRHYSHIYCSNKQLQSR